MSKDTLHVHVLVFMSVQELYNVSPISCKSCHSVCLLFFCLSVCPCQELCISLFHLSLTLSPTSLTGSREHGQRDEGTPPPVCYRNIQSTNERIRRVTRYSFVKPHTICKKKLIEWINLHTNPLIVSYTQCLDASGRRTLYIHNIHVVVL